MTKRRIVYICGTHGELANDLVLRDTKHPRCGLCDAALEVVMRVEVERERQSVLVEGRA